jgi:DNA-binding transcriptional ArsR family regulator
MDSVFKALADSSRRKLLDQLHMNSGQTLTQLSRDLAMTRQAVSKHLAILRRANLILPLWRGREKLHYLNPVPLAQISERWINKYEEGRLRALIELKRGLEENKPHNQ